MRHRLTNRKSRIKFTRIDKIRTTKAFPIFSTIPLADSQVRKVICKQSSENLADEPGIVPRRGPVPECSDLEAETYYPKSVIRACKFRCY